MTLVDSNQALDLLRKANRILIAPSTPDGDSIGSALALMLVLRRLGKEVTVVSVAPTPDYLVFLPHTEEIQSQISGSKDFVISLDIDQTEVDHLKYEVENGKLKIIVTPKNGRFTQGNVSFPAGMPQFDLIVTVDTGDLVQLGKLTEDYQDLFKNTPMLNIDHHSSNGKFGTYNFLDFKVSSTTQMLVPILEAFEKESGEKLIDDDVATLLLTGLVTDTGSFQHSNTTPEAFEVAAQLLDRGARQQQIIKHIFKTKSLATLKLWGRVLSKIQYDPELKLTYSTITLQDLADTGAESDDSGGIIDELMTNAPGAEIVMLLKEKEPGFVSGSFRAPGQLADVSQVASRMNGGGHKKAAGFRIREKTMDQALETALDVVRVYMAEVTTPSESSTTLFPGLASKPQASIPKPSEGGEDMLLEDFKKRQNPPVQDPSVKFFQDADGQIPPSATQEPTVGDVLLKMGQ